jgi:multidrug resistance efflux pump
MLQPAPYTETLLVTGKVRLDNAVLLKAEVEGTVAARPVAAGTSVRAGDSLVILENPELHLALSKAEAELLQAEAALRKSSNWSGAQQEASIEKLTLQLEQLQADLARTEVLYAASAVSESQLQNSRSLTAQAEASLRAEAAALAAQRQNASTDIASAQAQVLRASVDRDKARLQVERLTLKAPFEGIVTTSDLALGDRIAPGTPVVMLARSMDKACEISPDEKYLPLIKLGMPVILMSDARPEDPLSGTVNWIAPEVDAETGTVSVRISITEDRPWLIRNLMLRCELLLGEYPDSLIIPADLILPGEPPRVMVYENGEVILKPVILSAPRSGNVRILEGVQPGEIVLPPQGLAPGQRIRLTTEGGGGS